VDIERAIRRVPAGRWAVGISGGADSVALAAMLRTRPDLQLHLVHLDHQARGQQSADDARFVEALAARWKLPCTLATRQEVMPLLARLPRNTSALFRALRLALFEQVVRVHALDGVILAHHADDQAETVLHRLLRGAGPRGLAGMRPRTRLGQLLILRPLLGVPREALRKYLHGIGQDWREDPTNASARYLRSRIRALLQAHAPLTDNLLRLAATMGRWSRWLSRHAPRWPAVIAVRQVRQLPPPVAAEALRCWLISQGVPADAAGADAVDRLLAMAEDAASPPRQQFAGGLLVRRRGGTLFIEKPPPQTQAESRERPQS
jgi:tRNA(Ile)-lysidine synthetase-like protein